MTSYDEYQAILSRMAKDIKKKLVDFPSGQDTVLAAIATAMKMTKFQARAPIQPKQDVMYDIGLIDRVDNYINMDPALDHVKYSKVSEALASGNIYGVMISVNGVCYVFKSEEIFDIFQDRFKKTIAHDFGATLHKINVYHITPPEAKQKARLKYLSADEDEIRNVCLKLAELSNTSEDSIEIYQGEAESKIVMADKQGTWDEISADLAIYEELIKAQGDHKIKLYAKARVGDAVCPAEMIQLIKDHGLIINHYVVDQQVNIGGNNTGQITQGIIQTTLPPTKKSRVDIAKEWISANPYSTKKTRGDYHKKYIQCMDDEDRKYLNVQEFSKVMRSLGFVDKKGTIGRIWLKIGNDMSSDDDLDTE